MKLAVFLDAPNCFTNGSLDLREINTKLNKLGSYVIKRAYVTKGCSTKLIEALNNAGFEIIIFYNDVDAIMTADIVESIFINNIDAVVIISGDSDFLPAVWKAKKHGKKVIVITGESKLSISLKSAADEVFILPVRTD